MSDDTETVEGCVVRDSLDPRFASTFILCEATSFEKHALWTYWSTQAYQMGCRIGIGSGRPEIHRVEWKDDAMGKMIEIGQVDDRPVVLCVFWATLEGQSVLFYEATSQVVDHKMIEVWLKANVPAMNISDRHSDAQNLHNPIGEIHRENKRRSVNPSEPDEFPDGQGARGRR